MFCFASSLLMTVATRFATTQRSSAWARAAGAQLPRLVGAVASGRKRGRGEGDEEERETVGKGIMIVLLFLSIIQSYFAKRFIKIELGLVCIRAKQNVS